MSPRFGTGRQLFIDLDPARPQPLHQQISQHIRQLIASGRLVEGTCLPSSRSLASELRVSRSTVVLAFQQLRQEGFVAAAMGGATRVRACPRRFDPPTLSTTTTALRTSPLSRRADAMLEVPYRRYALGRTPRAFRTSVPALDLFPVDLWGRLLSRCWQKMSVSALGYGSPGGYEPLRQAIADYLGAARGVRCTAEQVIVTSGSQQALDLVTRVLLNPGDQVWLEDPGYYGARGAFIAAGATIVPVPVDAEGLVVATGQRLAPGARMAHVTPSRQLPLGMTLSSARRQALLAWAREAGAWIVEDDYASEFRYHTRPLPALQGLDEQGSVLYTGTFSKVMFPALRLGYLVVPERTLDGFLAARTFADFHSPHLEQAAMAAFMVEGHFERHVRRMRTLYRERQEALVEGARRELTGRLDVVPEDGGMNLIGWLPENENDVHVAQLAERHEVDVLPLSLTCWSRPIRPGLLLGYSGLDLPAIRHGIQRLSLALGESSDPRGATRAPVA